MSPELWVKQNVVLKAGETMNRIGLLSLTILEIKLLRS